MTSLNTDIVRGSASLVLFEWATGNVRRYTNWTDRIVFGGSNFSSVPEMSVDYGEQSGGTKDEPVKIILPSNIVPVSTLAAGTLSSEVFVTVWDIVPGQEASAVVSFKGSIRKTISNYQKKPGINMAEIHGVKARLRVRLGIPANHLCAWSFGDGNCGVDTSAITETGTVASIDGRDISVTGLTTIEQGYWNRGFVTKSGLNILIREHVSGGSFRLIQPPPLSWLGQTVVLTPGCDKAIETCRDRWNNEAQFCGTGIQIPDRHPLFEEGNDD